MKHHKLKPTVCAEFHIPYTLDDPYTLAEWAEFRTKLDRVDRCANCSRTLKEHSSDDREFLTE